MNKHMSCWFSRFIAVFLLLFAAPTFAGPGPVDLAISCDPRLQKGLERCLTALKLNQAAKRKNLSVVLVDITNPSRPRMAYINPNKMMYAASLPKIAILLGAFDRIAKGEMTLDDETHEKLALIISLRAELKQVGPLAVKYNDPAVKPIHYKNPAFRA